MWRVVLSMSACVVWALAASSGLIGMGYIIIAGIGIIPASILTIKLVMEEWEHEIMSELWSARCHHNAMAFKDSKAATKAALEKFLSQGK